MLVTYIIEGSCSVPEGTQALEGVANQFRLPTGEIFSIHPIVEMASGPDTDDHCDLSYQEAIGRGVQLEFYERRCELLPAQDEVDPSPSVSFDDGSTIGAHPKYVIAARVGSDDDDTGHEPLLFWNDELGFVSLHMATIFTEEEALAYSLPIADDQPEWVQLPDIPH